jgi:hypothetical protein
MSASERAQSSGAMTALVSVCDLADEVFTMRNLSSNGKIFTVAEVASGKALPGNLLEVRRK